MSTQREALAQPGCGRGHRSPRCPICDPHHHFWDREGDRYLLDQLTEDVRGGHNIAQDGLHRVPLDGTGARWTRGDAGDRRNRVRAGSGRPERQRPIRTDGGRGRHSGQRRPDAGRRGGAGAGGARGRQQQPVPRNPVPRAPGTPAPRFRWDDPPRPGCWPTRDFAPGSTGCSAWASASTRWCSTRSCRNWPTWPGPSRTPPSF